MHPARAQRAPGSFSPLTSTSTSTTPSTGNAPPPSRQPPPIPTERRPSSSSDDATKLVNPNNPPRTHQLTAAAAAAAASGKLSTPNPIYTHFTSHPNSSTSSLQNFSRPNLSTNNSRSPTTPTGTVDPLSPRLIPATARSVSSQTSSTISSTGKGHHRKYSGQGHFEPTLPSTSTSNLSQVGMAQSGSSAAAVSAAALSASQIAAQAAVLSHQQILSHHSRQRSQTVPTPGQSEADGQRRPGPSKGPLSPPLVSLTEASVPRESGFANQGYRNGLLGSHTTAATTAANVVFSRSGPASPIQPSHSPTPQSSLPLPDKPLKPEKEKSKVKLFSRPRKISTKGETDEKPMPSPGKIGSALSALQRGNFSTTSLVDSSTSSFYNLGNSSAATIRPIDNEKEGKEKEKKHHFLSRQKQKLKEEYHLTTSSSSLKTSESHGLGSLYNFSLPPSPAPTTTSFPKGITGLHGARRDKRKEERSESRMDNESIFSYPTESLAGSYPSNTGFLESLDAGKYGLSSISYDDAWPFLKAKLLVVFQGEDLRISLEDLNKVVILHIQYCIQRRSPNIILEDIRELLSTGFSSLDQALRKTPEDRVIPALVELWLFTFTSILPYMQAVFLPLDLEFAGVGTLLTPEKARDFWGGVLETGVQGAHVAPASAVIDVRRLVLNAYRDIVILPRYDTLKTIFSRLSLEFLPSSLATMALASPPPEAITLSTSPSGSFGSFGRPGTAPSVDPALSSYNSSSTTLLGEASMNLPRTRAISNVSKGSGTGSDGGLRPFTPSSLQALGGGSAVGPREQNVEDSKQVAELVGRMLQCMSVLASVGAVGDGTDAAGDEKMEELCRLLKLNWLGRGRTGRNRRGIVGGRVKRGNNNTQQQSQQGREEVRVS
ncbi:hypothetical protein jhhlp_000429 [Lomentospora prolificans]|uniref:HbrB-like protein n=1 Tax=Lomentospora prolificans TaxID=41688 RepID=A0A2N3NL04_9PEZI|nr:hypothetical protein jhhlp_000429 [Lomentospora prolificans]